jgi:hypothetical protein
MQYFNSIPKIITSDNNGNGIILTNLLSRVSIKQDLLNNPNLFYSYDLQEGDTPEIVAAKYYGDAYRYWLVLYANNIMNPSWDWPLSSGQFDSYMKDKYSAAAAAANISSVIAYTTGTIQEYRKTISTVDGSTLQTNTITILIDEDTYNSLATGLTTKILPSGATVSQTITGHAVSIYDYELEKNEEKRSIYIIDSIHVSQLESQFKSLMGT